MDKSKVTFEEWINEFQGFHTRAERFLDSPNKLEWLRMAWNMGYEQAKAEHKPYNQVRASFDRTDR